MANEKRLIDANALVNTLMSTIIDFHQVDRMNVAIKYVVTAPTVDAVEVVHGRWDGEYLDPRFICSECGKWFLVEDATGNMNYCPNCGANMMDGGKDNES